MASIIRIKRSSVSGNPTTLGAGELAYSAFSGAGGNRLYIGMGAETDGNAANHFVIGGTHYTGLIDASVAGTLTTTSSSIPVLSATGTIDKWLVGNLQLTGSTLSSTNTNGDINITPNGTGKTVVTNLYIGDTSTSIAEFIYDTVGGAVTGTTGQISVTNSDAANTSTIALVNTGVTAGSYGSATSIPTFTVDAQGRLTAAGSASITTSLGIAADTGSDTIALATDTITFAGGEGIDTSINSSTNTVTISAEDATTTNKGVASFDTNNFTVTNGAVSTKNITLGSSTLTNGSTTSSLAGLTELTVDQININGNTISSTDTNGNIIISPNGDGKIDVAGSIISGLAEPVLASDAATKNYVDTVAEGLHVHEAAKVATTDTLAVLSGGTVTYNNGTAGVGATLTLSSGLSGIDGYTLVNGDRILVKNEANQAHNGMYVRTSATVLTRATDFDTAAEIAGGDFTFVENGTTYGNTGWVQTFEVTTVGTDTIIWQQFAGQGTFTAGNGLVLTGTEFNVVGTADRITANANSIDIASTYVGQSSITTLGTIGTGVWQGTAIADAYVANDLTISGGTVNNTPIGASTPSSAAFTTLTANGAVTLTSTTDATALGTAAVVLSGGLSVAKAMYVGTNITGAGPATSTIDGFNIDCGTY